MHALVNDDEMKHNVHGQLDIENWESCNREVIVSDHLSSKWNDLNFALTTEGLSEIHLKISVT